MSNSNVKLDAEIAGKIMGLKVTDHGFGRFTVPGKLKGEATLPLPYSTDIAAAWAVLEKLKQSNDLVEVFWDQAWFCKAQSPAAMYSAHADEAPMAICMLALETLK